MLRFLRAWRRRRILARADLDDAAWQEALRRVPSAQGLEPAELGRLRELTILFLHEKSIEGVRGAELTTTMRLVIALQACLLILNLGIDAYAGWRTILVYPGRFRPKHEWTDELGIVHVDRHPLAGEAWQGGPVVLSWEDVEEGALWPGDGYNVVIHELAHKLDMQDGEANGCPRLHPEQDALAWQRDFKAAWEQLCAAVERGAPTPIDEYGAEGPDEFFAVLSEAFFEIPRALAQWSPAIYGHLRDFYRQDPAAR